MLDLPLTGENLSLLTALQAKLGVTPTPALLALVRHSGADNPLRGLLFEYLQLQIGFDVLTTGLLDLLQAVRRSIDPSPRRADAGARGGPCRARQTGRVRALPSIAEGYAKAHAYGAEQAKHYRATDTKALTQSVESQKASAIAAKEQAARFER